MASAGARPALSGFRRQFLYAIHRLLTSPNVRVRLEGHEDLDVIDAEGNLIETIQVKAYTENLQFSHLVRATEEGGFLGRMRRILEKDQSVRATIVSYGPIGPELSKAWNREGAERKAVLEKLESVGFREHDADLLLKQTTLEVQSEQRLTDEVYEILGKIASGHDTSASFNLLMFWIWAGSESSDIIDRDALVKKLEQVGRYVAGRSSVVEEWFRTIIPLTREMQTMDRGEASEAFRAGAAARFEHTCLGLDISRPRLMSKISEQVERFRVVIIRGASGQGKSTIAYRWLHDNVLETQRLWISSIDDRRHARNIALALESFLTTTGISAHVYLDVQPGSVTWTELLAASVRVPHLRLLVAIREEDWRKAEAAIPAIRMGEVLLEFSKEEAVEIYSAACNRGTPPSFVDFEDAWHRFNGGPLLEFMFLLNQSVLLRERLKQQVADLRRNNQNDAVALLRWGVYADAYDSRLDTAETVKRLGIIDGGYTLHLLEEEYLLRRDEEKKHICGVHAIRSTILMEILEEFDAGITPWLLVAQEMLPAIVEADREIFLLHSFSRRKKDRDALVQSLNRISPKTWLGSLGIIHSLLWLGIVTHVEANRPVIDEAYGEYLDGWWLHLGQDITASEGINLGPSLSKSIDGLLQLMPAARQEKTRTLRSQLASPDGIPARASNWLLNTRLPESIPIDSSEIAAAGELLFWQAHWGMKSWFSASSADLTNLEAIDDLDAIGVLILAAWRAGELLTVAGLQKSAVAKYQNRPDVIAVVDDGVDVCVEYIIELLNSAESSGVSPDRYINTLAVRHCRAMRMLLPGRSLYKCNGHGHESLLRLDYDPSTKAIPPEGLPPDWLPRLNSVYTELGTLEYRLNNWDDWCERILTRREMAHTCMGKLIDVLIEYFRRAAPRHFSDALLEEVNSCANELRFQPPVFPRCAVDEWGFVADGLSDSVYAQKTNWSNPRGLVILQLSPVRTALQDYFQSVHNFFDQAPLSMRLCVLIAERDGGSAAKKFVEHLVTQKGENFDRIRLSIINLSYAFSRMSKMQTAFRDAFASRLDVNRLALLEHREADVLNGLMPLWYEFVASPEKLLRTRRSIHQGQQRWLRELKRNMRLKARSLGLNIIHVEEVSRGGELPGIWIVCDVGEYGQMDEAVGLLTGSIHEMLPRLGSERCAWLVTCYKGVMLVPLVRGRNILRLGLWYDLDHLAGRGGAQPSFVMLDAELEERIGLAPCIASEILDCAREILGAAQELRVTYGHYEDVVACFSEARSVKPSYLMFLENRVLEMLGVLGSAMLRFTETLSELQSRGDGERSRSLGQMIEIMKNLHGHLGLEEPKAGEQTAVEDWAFPFILRGFPEKFVELAVMYAVETEEMK